MWISRLSWSTTNPRRLWLASWRTRIAQDCQATRRGRKWQSFPIKFPFVAHKHKLSTRVDRTKKKSLMRNFQLPFTRISWPSTRWRRAERSREEDESEEITATRCCRRSSLNFNSFFPLRRSEASQCTIGEEKWEEKKLETRRFPFSFFSHSWTSSCGRVAFGYIFILLNEWMGKNIFTHFSSKRNQ